MLEIKQIKSTNKITQRQVETVRCLGLRRVGHVVVRKETPALLGMLKKVEHLVEWKPAAGAAAKKK